MPTPVEVYRMSDADLLASIDQFGALIAEPRLRGSTLERSFLHAQQRHIEEAFTRQLERVTAEYAGYYVKPRADVPIERGEQMRRCIEAVWELQARGLVAPWQEAMVLRVIKMLDERSRQPLCAEACRALAHDADADVRRREAEIREMLASREAAHA